LCYDCPRVRILLDYRPALRERTGVGEYVHQLAAALARRLSPDDRLTLVSSSWRDRLSPDVVTGASVVDLRIPVRVLNAAWHRLGAPAVERFAGEADVAHSPSPLLMPSSRAAQVVTIHDLDFLDHPERTRAEIRRDYPSLAPRHVPRADHVIAVSGHTAGEVERRLGVARDRISVCSPGAPGWTARAGPVPDGPILFMGTLEPRKNVGLLIDAYARLRARFPAAPKLLLAGRAAEGADAWLRKIAEAPLRGHVEHIGYVAADRRYALYCASSMVVLPSHTEGFGLPALEAMTAGVPVVVTRAGALPEVVGDAGFLVERDDAEAMTAAMHAVLTDAARTAQAVGRGVLRARRYSWDASAALLLDAYRQAMERRRSKTR
jgi:glycosyltransferase involved in cell wall biosynthesis